MFRYVLFLSFSLACILLYLARVDTTIETDYIGYIICYLKITLESCRRRRRHCGSYFDRDDIIITNVIAHTLHCLVTQAFVLEVQVSPSL